MSQSRHGTTHCCTIHGTALQNEGSTEYTVVLYNVQANFCRTVKEAVHGGGWHYDQHRQLYQSVQVYIDILKSTRLSDMSLYFQIEWCVCQE